MLDLLAAAERHREDTIELIETLAAIESPSTDKAALDRCGAEISRRLALLGGRVTRLPQATAGDHVRAEFGDGAAQVLLLGHFDTVWPLGQLPRMPITRTATTLAGPGVFDMKAGIAQAMLAVRVLADLGRLSATRVVMLWTSDEEVGSSSSRAALEAEASRSRAVFVLEPALAGGAVKTARKGVGDFRVTARGISAHAGVEPGRGASAVHELARQVLQVLDLADVASGLTVNVGRISGGTRANVVAESATMDVDVRIATLADAERVTAAMAALVPIDGRVALSVEGGIDRPPMERTRGTSALFERARQIAGRLGRELAEGATGGGSDGNFTSAIAPTLDGLGPEGAGAHALDEHILLEPLAFRAALLAGLIENLED